MIYYARHYFGAFAAVGEKELIRGSKYRVVEEVTPKGDWEIAGVIALWPEDPPAIQLRSMLEHTVSRPIWDKIRQRVKARGLTLETYHEALEDYERYYRIRPDVYSVTGETAAEIRDTPTAKGRGLLMLTRKPLAPGPGDYA